MSNLDKEIKELKKQPGVVSGIMMIAKDANVSVIEGMRNAAQELMEHNYELLKDGIVSGFESFSNEELMDGKEEVDAILMFNGFDYFVAIKHACEEYFDYLEKSQVFYTVFEISEDNLSKN